VSKKVTQISRPRQNIYSPHHTMSKLENDDNL